MFLAGCKCFACGHLDLYAKDEPIYQCQSEDCSEIFYLEEGENGETCPVCDTSDTIKLGDESCLSCGEGPVHLDDYEFSEAQLVAA